MRSIGVRELRQNASRYLEAVAAGESIEITDRGNPVARLVPITGDPWQDLISAGEIIAATTQLSVKDIEPASYPRSGSAALDQLRVDER
jgi:prevent-host-death family protein